MRLTPDVLPAVVLAALGAASAHAIDGMDGADRRMDAAGLALIVAAALVLLVRRRWPVPVLAVVTGLASGYLVLGYPYGPILLSFALAVYTVARALPLVPAAVSCGLALAVLMLHVFFNAAALPGLLGLIPATAWALVPFTVGTARRMLAEAQVREREQVERRLVDGERLRLAQEVHDVVGHGLAAIQMQADIALHVIGTGADADPAQARTALTAISAASAEALSELRVTLAAIAPEHGSGPESRAPTPGLHRLGDLVERVAAAGVQVDTEERGRRRPLAAHVDVAAYRVLQESLTNVVRHSPHPHARIQIVWGAGEVELVVTNQDALGGPFTEGMGISGMRRRVETAGGRFAVGTTGGFTVRAVLPAPDVRPPT